jgi:hypothetical protein
MSQKGKNVLYLYGYHPAEMYAKNVALRLKELQLSGIVVEQSPRKRKFASLLRKYNARWVVDLHSNGRGKDALLNQPYIPLALICYGWYGEDYVYEDLPSGLSPIEIVDRYGFAFDDNSPLVGIWEECDIVGEHGFLCGHPKLKLRYLEPFNPEVRKLLEDFVLKYHKKISDFPHRSIEILPTSRRINPHVLKVELYCHNTLSESLEFLKELSKCLQSSQF